MTLPPDPYSDASSTPSPGAPTNAAPGRQVTEGMRQLTATALLAGNGVFLFLGVSDLIFVVSGWISQFGARSEATFGTFAGPVAIALPLLAMLIAAHVSPPLPQARAILIAVLAQYAVSAFFGVITYLGAFAEGVFSVRATFNGLLGRAVWLAFLTIAITAAYRMYRTMYPPAPRYSYGQTVYGRPYPGQPTYPRPTHYGPGSSEPRYEPVYPPVVEVPTAETSVVAPVAGVPPQTPSLPEPVTRSQPVLSPPPTPLGPPAQSAAPPPAAPQAPSAGAAPEATVRMPPPAAEATRQMPPVAGGGARQA